MKSLFKFNKSNNSGFTLVELMVAISLFTVVSLISVGALLTVVDANRRAQSLKSAVNNLTFGLEGLAKNMRVGNTYHCNIGPAIPFGFDTPRDCSGGAVPEGNLIAFESSNGDPFDSSDQVIYRLNVTTLERSTDGGSLFLPVTSSEVEVTDFDVYVFGSEVGDFLHSRTLIILRGFVDLGNNARTDFNIQTTISQRGLDT
jgi:prepilin-type N-terminal cleavage/methylation domain-containing protein